MSQEILVLGKLFPSVLSDLQAKFPVLHIEGVDAFADTRRFYAQRGYTREAVIRDYWAEGDDKVIYWKSLKA